MTHRQFPGCLDTPWGRAILVVGSTLGGGVPCYEIGSTVMSIDTRIPDGLAGRWFWAAPWGLSDGGVCIATVSHPPPLCYEQAREIERAMGRLEERNAPRQLAMELV